MVRWMCGASLRVRVLSGELRDRVLSGELREIMGIESVYRSNVVKRNRLGWLGHVILRKDYGHWMKKCMLYEVERVRGIRGRCGIRR